MSFLLGTKASIIVCQLSGNLTSGAFLLTFEQFCCAIMSHSLSIKLFITSAFFPADTL
jgi:hypothetical protein